MCHVQRSCEVGARPSGLCLALLPARAFPQGIDLGDITGEETAAATSPRRTSGSTRQRGPSSSPRMPPRSRRPGRRCVQPSPTASQYIDSVFFIGPNEDPPVDPFLQEITRAGSSSSSGGGCHRHGLQLHHVPGGADAEIPIVVGEINTWTTGVGLHSSTGITYDLAAIRAPTGTQASAASRSSGGG